MAEAYLGFTALRKIQGKMAGCQKKSVIFAADSMPRGVSMGNFSIKPLDVSMERGRSVGSLAGAVWRSSCNSPNPRGAEAHLSQIEGALKCRDPLVRGPQVLNTHFILAKVADVPEVAALLSPGL